MSSDAPVFRYNYATRHVPFMVEQIWEAHDNLDVYHSLAAFEFDQIFNLVGRPLSSIMEMGCGLGRGSIYLNWLLNDPAIRYTLADRTGWTRNTGAFNPLSDEVYNDLFLTADFCSLNGMTPMRLFDTEEGDWTTLEPADLIFSLCSFGVHVPIERYLDRLIAALAPGGTLLFGVRWAYGPDSFKDRFREVIFREGIQSQIYPNENWLILRDPF